MASLAVIEKKYKEADSALTKSNPSKAAHLLRELVKIEPDEPLFHWRLGYALSEMGRFRDAIIEFQQALKLDPVNIAAWGSLGKAYIELEDWKSAREAFEKRLSLKESPQHYVFLAYVLLQTEQFDQAAKCCRKAIDLDRSFAEAHYNLGFAYRYTNRRDQALVSFKRAVELDNKFSDGFRELGLSYYGIGDVLSAKKAIETCLSLNPDDAWGHLYLALCLEYLEDHSQAAKHFRAALNRDPENSFFQEQYAEFRRQQNIHGNRRRPSGEAETGEVNETALTAALAHMIGTASGGKLLPAAAKNYRAGQRFTRADLAEVLGTSEATVWAWIRQLGRPEKRLRVTVFERHNDGSYSLTKPIRDAILKLLRRLRY